MLRLRFLDATNVFLDATKLRLRAIWRTAIWVVGWFVAFYIIRLLGGSLLEAVVGAAFLVAIELKYEIELIKVRLLG